MLLQLGHALVVVAQGEPFRHALTGALSGWAVAAKTDWAAFVGWKDYHEALQYDWGVALWRWFQGAVIGAVGVTGFGALLG